MTKKSARQSAIPSPCISVCTINGETGYCEGCRRSIDEIADWDSFTDLQKQQTLELLKERAKDT